MTDLVGFRAAKLGGGRLVCGMDKSGNLNLFSVLCRCRVFCCVLGTGLLFLSLLHASDPSFLLFAGVKMWTCLLVSKHLLIDFYFFNSLPFCSPQVTSFSAGSTVI